MSFETSQPSIYFATLYSETLLHGIYTVLFGLAMFVVVRGKFSFPSNASMDVLSKKPKQPLTWTRIWLIIVTVLMFCVATVHSAIGLRQAFSDIVVEDGVVYFNSSPASPWEYAKLALEVVNCVLGDTIVLWRVMKIERAFGVNYFALSALLGLFAGSAIAGVAMVFTASRTTSFGDVVHEPLGAWIIAWSSLTLATNVFAIAMIAYRRLFGTNRSVTNSKPLHHQILTIFIESGSLYSCTFALLLFLFGFGLDVSYLLNHIIPQLAGIYPTLIVVLVCWRSHNHHASFISNIRVVSPPTPKARRKLSRRKTEDFDVFDRGKMVIGIHHEVEQVTDVARSSMDTVKDRSLSSPSPMTVWERYQMERGDLEASYDDAWIGRAQ